MNENNELNNNGASVEPIAPIEPAVEPTPVEPVPPVEQTTPAEPIQPVETTQPAVTSVKEAIAQPIESTPVDNKLVESATSKSNNKSCIVPVILILLFLGLLVGGGIGGFVLYRNFQGSGGGSSSSSGNKKDEPIEPPKCNIDREHIHLSDLSDEDLEKIKISYSLGMLRTYTDSDIKSIVFNGKEYDYKEVVAALTDFDKVTTMIAQENSSIHSPIDKMNISKDDAIYYLTYVHGTSVSETIKQTFYVVGKNDKITDEKTYSKRFIEVSWAWDYGKKITTKVDGKEFADSSYYGQHYRDHDYIKFSVDRVELYDVTEDYGFVLNDGRYVHMLRDIDGLGYKKWNLTKNIYVTNRTYE